MKKYIVQARAKGVVARAAIIERDLVLAVAVVLLITIGGVFLGHQNNGVVPANSDPVARYQGEPQNPLTFMANWDAPDYIGLSQHGYQDATQTNFFPFYPLLIRLVNMVVPSALFSALLVAWVGFVGAVYFYLKVAKRLYKLSDNHEALRALLLFVLFPTGVFLFAPYTEGIFGCLALGAIYYALQKKYVPAALFCLFATATHITGVFVLILVGLLLLEEGGKLTKTAAAVATGSLGLVSYMAYLQVHFHDALDFIMAQKGHGWLQHKYAQLVTELGAINGLIIVLLILSIIYWWPRRKSFAVYSALFLTIPIVGAQLGGFNRYCLMAFPVQFMVYEYCRKRPLAYGLAVAGFSILWAHYVFQYAAGYVGG